MSDKQTFVDPESGKEIESTGLAKIASMIVRTMVGFLKVMPVPILISVLSIRMLAVFSGRSPGIVWELVGLFFMWLFVWLGYGVSWGLFVGVVSAIGGYTDIVRDDRLAQPTHDRVARWQHRRRQRVLRAQEHQDVPDTALSRAQPPGEPVPTDTALSLADDPDEPSRLSVEIEEHTEDQVPVNR